MFKRLTPKEYVIFFGNHAGGGNSGWVPVVGEWYAGNWWRSEAWFSYWW